MNTTIHCTLRCLYVNMYGFAGGGVGALKYYWPRGAKYINASLCIYILLPDTHTHTHILNLRKM